jgi:hypothetical protein
MNERDFSIGLAVFSIGLALVIRYSPDVPEWFRPAIILIGFFIMSIGFLVLAQSVKAIRSQTEPERKD